mmetsp:Transcript_17592/g.25413  ORF Transcript_17592/g.25413 Transcript_17592/m.25413 type:complete len:327 (+) Transcript_17592:17-997(+)
MKFLYLSIALLGATISISEAFVITPGVDNALRKWSGQRTTTTTTRRSTQQWMSTEEQTETDPLGLPPELRKITNAFARVDDHTLRHKQLLYMANQLPIISPEKCTPENKVPGCLSTVFVDGTATWSDEKQGYVIDYVGECDGLLTKGLVALLVRGLSGSTAKEIEMISPEFIQEAQIGQSLTPGRNNGFLNMLTVMKRKAIELTEEASGVRSPASSSTPTSEEEEEETDDELDLSGDRPMYDGIIKTLQVLKPTKLELTDDSDQHAGHAGSKGFNGESHFDLFVVSEAFDGLNLVKRHQLIYMLLGNIMPKIHALKIRAKTPSEVE